MRRKQHAARTVRVHTLVVGSGAAGLNAAVQLRKQGVDDVLVITEGLAMGTSINTGSDKQTYYKLAMCGADADSPMDMAATFFAGGSMHGDLALVEAGLSARAFLHLVNLGIPFPRDEFGQFVGYKTDHDPRQRATSIGPYTSREMCRALIAEVKRLGIPVREGRHAVRLLTAGVGARKRSVGVIAVTREAALEAYLSENVVFAVGGPGGLYRASVYPACHTGAIGVALEAGAVAQGLPEGQFGMASTRFRWNVSGTYMQVIPRFISRDRDGGDEREFLRGYFASAGEMNSQVFLKGYQWPFDSRKAAGGSSLIDILVYIETVVKGRRVFLDYRRNPDGYDLKTLSREAREYLEKSGARQSRPIGRLRHMNPAAIQLYREHGIFLEKEPLEIAVCAQHNNGGLAANLWWESLNIAHLFPVGEVNGSHGVYRPGGSALNSGQVGSFRAAEYIANRYGGRTAPRAAAESAARAGAAAVRGWIRRCGRAGRTWREERDELQARMSRAGAHIRSSAEMDRAVAEAWGQFERVDRDGCRCATGADAAEALQTRSLCFAHAVYLDAIRYAIAGGLGSRGSAIVLGRAGRRLHGKLDASWAMVPENEAFRKKVQETVCLGAGRVRHAWVPVRPIPAADAWFETAWARFRSGAIYGPAR